MKYKVLALFLFLLGMYGSLSQWVYYPRIDSYLLGLQGDGWLFFIPLLIVFIVTLFSRFNFLTSKYYPYFLLLLGFVFSALSYYKINSFSNELNSFITDDPWLLTASAGAKLSFGLYLLFLTSFIIFLLGCFLLLLKRKKISL
jgi:hypothetical protein